MNVMKKVTFVIHTFQRPHFLIRLVRYFDSVAALRGARIILADGTSEADAVSFDEWLAANPVGLDLIVMRYAGTTLMERLGLVLEKVGTPYVVLGADDDFYFFDWIDDAVATIERGDGIGVVYGDFIQFELGGFIPTGDAVKFGMPRFENPPFAWLEADSMAERLSELAEKKLGLATAGWYSLQRTELLATIVDYGRKFDLVPLMFERFLVVAQASATKTRMLRRVIGARQVELFLYRAPFRYRGNEHRVAALIACCVAYLVEQCEVEEDEARALTHNVLKAEIALMKAADRKKTLRSAAQSLPFLRSLWRKIRPIQEEHLLRDERLPPILNVDLFKREQAIITNVVTPMRTSSTANTRVDN